MNDFSTSRAEKQFWTKYRSNTEEKDRANSGTFGPCLISRSSDDIEKIFPGKNTVHTKAREVKGARLVPAVRGRGCQGALSFLCPPSLTRGTDTGCWCETGLSNDGDGEGKANIRA